MTEPESGLFKDAEGFTWVRRGNAWSLLHHDELCYQDLSFARVERDYGPLRPLTKYEQVYFRG